MEIGTYCIVRTESAGVWAGDFKSREGQEVTLTNAINIWEWDGANTLADMAQDGVAKPRLCKFSNPVNEVLLLQVISIFPTTEKAEASIKGVEVRPWWN